MAVRGTARQGSARQGDAWCGMVRQGADKATGGSCVEADRIRGIPM